MLVSQLTGPTVHKARFFLHECIFLINQNQVMRNLKFGLRSKCATFSLIDVDEF